MYGITHSSSALYYICTYLKVLGECLFRRGGIHVWYLQINPFPTMYHSLQYISFMVFVVIIQITAGILGAVFQENLVSFF